MYTADDPNWLASKRWGAAVDGDGWDEDGHGDVASVAFALTCLGADDIDTGIECLFDTLGVANHLFCSSVSVQEAK